MGEFIKTGRSKRPVFWANVGHYDPRMDMWRACKMATVINKEARFEFAFVGHAGLVGQSGVFGGRHFVC
jgi:hypothetical protein